MVRRRPRAAAVSPPVADGARLAVGTLTVFPVPAPRTVDRDTGAWAMTFAPVVGALLAVPALALTWLLDRVAAPPALAALLAVALLALTTRAIHLDGLADTADGLGSARPAAEALAVMRRSDIGPFGVVTLVLVLGLQVASLTALDADGRGARGLALALVVSRLALPLACSRGIPAARADGLGRTVAGTVSLPRLTLAGALAGVAVLVAFVAVPATPTTPALTTALTALVVAVAGVAAAGLLCGWCVRRLGGVTGDVLGGCVEVAFTTVLVVLALG
jgi:adenosylcobinamide-GDP ribazoletransferase